MNKKTPEQLKNELVKTKESQKKANLSRLKGMQDLHNGIYTFIYDTYKREGVPVDKFGRFYSRGGLTVDQLVSPDFSDIDFILACVLDIKAKLEGKKKV